MSSAGDESGKSFGELIHHARWTEALEKTLAVDSDPALSVPVLGWNDVPGWDGAEPDPDRFPTTGKPSRWVQISATRGSADAGTMSGRQRRIKWYLVTLVVAPRADEVRAVRDRLHGHRDRRVPIPFGSPLRLADEDDVRRLDDRGGLFEGMTTWWYTTRP